MSATVKLVRENVMMELRPGTFEILVDGQTAGSVDTHQTTEVPIEPGPHTVQVRTGRYSSGVHRFEVNDGDVVTYRCNSARVWPVYLASLVKPDLALLLRHE